MFHSNYDCVNYLRNVFFVELKNKKVGTAVRKYIEQIFDTAVEKTFELPF